MSKDRWRPKTDAQPPETATSTSDGTPAYMAPEQGPDAKAAHCAGCHTRFVPVGGEDYCAACAAEHDRARADGILCRVAGPGEVRANGRGADGKQRSRWAVGSEARFSAVDVKSLPGKLVPVESEG